MRLECKVIKSEMITNILTHLAAFLLLSEMSNRLTMANGPGTSLGKYFAEEIDRSVGYEKKGIIKQTDKASLLSCLLHCCRKKECKHIVFKDETKTCTLLKEVIHHQNEPLQDGERLYSQVQFTGAFSAFCCF